MPAGTGLPDFYSLASQQTAELSTATVVQVLAVHASKLVPKLSMPVTAEICQLSELAPTLI